MRILMDADACPVQEITEGIARKYKLKLFIYCDINHQLINQYGKIIKVDKAFQAVDMKIFNDCQAGDIIVTNDYGLAALVLGKKANVIDHNGRVFSDDNINYLLQQRHYFAKMRKAGCRHPTQKKRKKENDQTYTKSINILITKIRGD